jgi:hypothetical protein
LIVPKTGFQWPGESLPFLCAAALFFALSGNAVAQRPDTQPSTTPRAPAQQLDKDGTGSPLPGSAGGSVPAAQASPSPTPEPPDKRIFGVLPNYRTANSDIPFQPLTAKQKFGIAMKDSFDWPIIPLSGAFAGLYQLENSNPSFGQGLQGYAHRR